MTLNNARILLITLNGKQKLYFSPTTNAVSCNLKFEEFYYHLVLTYIHDI